MIRDNDNIQLGTIIYVNERDFLNNSIKVPAQSYNFVNKSDNFVIATNSFGEVDDISIDEIVQEWKHKLNNANIKVLIFTIKEGYTDEDECLLAYTNEKNFKNSFGHSKIINIVFKALMSYEETVLEKRDYKTEEDLHNALLDEFNLTEEEFQLIVTEYRMRKED